MRPWLLPTTLSMILWAAFSCTPQQRPWRQSIEQAPAMLLEAPPDRALLIEVEASDRPAASAKLQGKTFSLPVEDLGDERFRLVLPPGARLEGMWMGGYGCSPCVAQCGVPSGTHGRVTRSTLTTFWQKQVTREEHMDLPVTGSSLQRKILVQASSPPVVRMRGDSPLFSDAPVLTQGTIMAVLGDAYAIAPGRFQAIAYFKNMTGEFQGGLRWYAEATLMGACPDPAAPCDVPPNTLLAITGIE
jgi:hypothetical protein